MTDAEMIEHLRAEVLWLRALVMRLAGVDPAPAPPTADTPALPAEEAGHRPGRAVARTRPADPQAAAREIAKLAAERGMPVEQIAAEVGLPNGQKRTQRISP
jgi:hypothetical protein